MKKGLTDLIFVLSLIGFIWNTVQESIHSLVSTQTFAIVSVVFTAIAAATYFLYNEFTGTLPAPQPPMISVSAVPAIASVTSPVTPEVTILKSTADIAPNVSVTQVQPISDPSVTRQPMAMSSAPISESTDTPTQN